MQRAHLVGCCTPARAGRRGVKQAAPARMRALVALDILPAARRPLPKVPKEGRPRLAAARALV